MTNTSVLLFRTRGGHFEQICDYQSVFSVLDELRVSHYAWYIRRCCKSALQKYEIRCFIITSMA